MTPLDPIIPVRANPQSATAPPYVDEDPNVAMVERGLEAAENETRDAVADAYEASARLADESIESLDDIDFTEGEDRQDVPELAAVHEEPAPEGDGQRL